MDREPFPVTWETVTAESAEHGDAAARGFMATGVFAAYRGEFDPPAPGSGPDKFFLREAVKALSDDLPGNAELEALEPNDSDPRCARWVSAHFRRYDGATIGETRAIHFPESLTPSSRARLVALLCS